MGRFHFGLCYGYACLALLAWICCSCNSTPKDSSPVYPETENSFQEVPGDFQLFYDRFHSDSAFQMDHILFPLEGLPANADSLTDPENFRWLKDEWVIHRPLSQELSQSFTREWKLLGNDIVIESIIQPTARIGMLRRFAKMDEEWMLIYYSGMNPL